MTTYTRAANRRSIIDEATFTHALPAGRGGIDTAEVPGFEWLLDENETAGDFLSRVRREVRALGFANFEVRGRINVDEPRAKESEE